jgi:hypothetical protein
MAVLWCCGGAMLDFQPLWQRLQITPCRSDLRVNKIQYWRVRKYFKEGANHFLLSDSADAFNGSDVICGQKHSFVMGAAS